jgi:hypothetical protein
LPRDSALVEKVGRLREELAQAEGELKADFERRQKELAEEMRDCGILGAASSARKGKRIVTCRSCGQPGHNARGCPKGSGKSARKQPRKREAAG